jgi:hypothetical protein
VTNVVLMHFLILALMVAAKVVSATHLAQSVLLLWDGL